jgi:SAM-dependent methyltransferase
VASSLLESKLESTRKKFDALAADRPRWKKRNWYYYKKVTDYFRFFIPEGARVLEIGSGDGDLLAALKPLRGLGIDASPAFVELSKKNHPNLEFRQGFAETFSADEKFDFIILSDLVGYLEDVQLVLQQVKKVCHPSTRIIINYYNYLWEPVLRLGNSVGLRMKQDIQNWLSLADLENLLYVSGFDTIKKTRKVLLPIYIPLVSEFF